MVSTIANTFLAIALFVVSTQLAIASINDLVHSYELGSHSDVVVIYENLKTDKKSVQSNILMKIADSYEKLNRHKVAAETYEKAILNSKFKKQFLKVQRKIKDGDFIENSDIEKKYLIYIWNIYTNYYKFIITQKNKTDTFDKVLKKIELYNNILSELEYNEDEVDSILDKVIEKDEILFKSEYTFVYNYFIDFMSWQRDLTLIKNDNSRKASIIVTNTSFCFGLNMSYENYFRAFKLDGCALVGSGNFSLNDGDIEKFEQSGVSVTGIRATPKLSFYTTEKKAEIGIGVPLLFISQTIEEPQNFSFENDESFYTLISLYSKWTVGSYFVQTEFAQFTNYDSSMWSIGIGQSF